MLNNLLGDDPLLAVDTIMFYGQALFAVVADTRDQARRAARKARVSTAPAMPAIDVDDAIVADTKVLPDYQFVRREPAEELIRAPRRLQPLAVQFANTLVVSPLV